MSLCDFLVSPARLNICSLLQHPCCVKTLGRFLQSFHPLLNRQGILLSEIITTDYKEFKHTSQNWVNTGHWICYVGICTLILAVSVLPFFKTCSSFETLSTLRERVLVLKFLVNIEGQLCLVSVGQSGTVLIKEANVSTIKAVHLGEINYQLICYCKSSIIYIHHLLFCMLNDKFTNNPW